MGSSVKNAENAPDLSRALRFRVARADDIGAVVALLSEAAAWARTRGIDRWWPVPYPVEWVAPSVHRGEVVVLERGPILVGTLALTHEDSRIWGERPPDAGYVHRLAIRRDCAHQGLGARALDWAQSTVRSWGRTKLRLDCLATNESLVRYYLRLGFREVGRVPGYLPRDDRPSVLLERSFPEATRSRATE